MYSGISYAPREYTGSEMLAMTYGLHDYEAMQERVANYIKTAYTTRRGVSDTTANPAVTDEGRAFGEIFHRGEDCFSRLACHAASS